MYKLKEFLYKFFNPRGLKSFKNMSMLIAILIFLVEAYLLFFPINYIYTKKPEKYTKENEYTRTFYNIEGNISDEMKASNYKITNYQLTSSDQEEGIKIYKYQYDENNNVYFIFDVNGYVSNEMDKISDSYKSKYPGESEDKINYSSLLIYTDVNKGSALDASIDIYHNKDINTIIEELNNLQYFEIYGLNDENAHVLLFEKDFLYIEFLYEGTYINNYINYHISENYKNVNFNDYNDITELSQFFVIEFGRTFAKNSALVYLGTVVIYAIVYPVLFALILFLVLRKRGSVKRFKEHYNIISITSIVPFLISFVLAWFITTTSSIVFLASFTIYSLIMAYSISGIND